jgi:hypothetical protein
MTILPPYAQAGGPEEVSQPCVDVIMCPASPLSGGLEETGFASKTGFPTDSLYV